MRDVLLCVLLSTGALIAISRPWFGVMLWALISIMNPHRLSWGFAYSIPWAQITVVTTFLGMMLSTEGIRMTWRAPVIFLILFTVWQSIAYQFSFDRAASF